MLGRTSKITLEFQPKYDLNKERVLVDYWFSEGIKNYIIVNTTCLVHFGGLEALCASINHLSIAIDLAAISLVPPRRGYTVDCGPNVQRSEAVADAVWWAREHTSVINS